MPRSDGTLSAPVAAEMERLWVTTRTHQDEIAALLNAAFGTTFHGKNVEWHARRREWYRELIGQSFNNRSRIEDRLFTKAWQRWAEPKRRDNPVRLVERGTFAVRGFSMLGGSVR